MPDPRLALLYAALLTALGLWVLWPRQGLLARFKRTRRGTDRVRSEDALKHIHQCETSGRRPSVQSIAGALETTLNVVAELLPEMQRAGLIVIAGDELRLTPRGRSSALHIIRAHRLWERHLADETGVAEAEWHRHAERHEHRLSPRDADELSAHLGHPAFDPHGDPIPTESGELAPAPGQPLTAMPEDASVRIVHLEDEPAVLYAQLAASGLHPGMEGRLLENSPLRVRFWAGGDEHVLAPIVAANISVLPLAEEVPVDRAAGERLSQLEPGESGRVVSLSPALRGIERRRLVDLGILPDTVIRAELRSPSADPTAYRIRGALVALRREQASLIHIEKLKQEVPTP